MQRSPITTHVLDVSRGHPAHGVPVVLEREKRGEWFEVSRRTTDDDGRIHDLIAPHALEAGHYRLTFDVAAYNAAHGITSFYPTVQITFSIVDPRAHYHVPLLLSPYGYSTYRGS
jgi:5-hydroxyisourate hydrolase